MSFQTCMTFFLLRNTKENVSVLSFFQFNESYWGSVLFWTPLTFNVETVIILSQDSLTLGKFERTAVFCLFNQSQCFGPHLLSIQTKHASKYLLCVCVL